MTGKIQTNRVVHSASTRALIRERAKASGQQRSDDVEKRVRAAMADIQKEMVANDRIYPQNKGRVSSAEVARRAGVHSTTLFSPKQRALGEEVKQWLKRLKTSQVVGHGAVRRAFTERIADWKSLYAGLAQSHRDTELELQQTEADLADAREQVRKLQSENTRLMELLSATNRERVVTLRPKKD